MFSGWSCLNNITENIEEKLSIHLIQPAAGDAGGSLGAAAFWYQELKKSRVEFKDQMRGSYLDQV